MKMRAVMLCCVGVLVSAARSEQRAEQETDIWFIVVDNRYNSSNTLHNTQQGDGSTQQPMNEFPPHHPCKLSQNQLEKLEAARSAYLWLPLVTFGYL